MVVDSIARSYSACLWRGLCAGLLWPDHYGNGYTLIQVPTDLQSFDSIGITDEELVIAFLGRVVMEKGLDVFADAINAFATYGLKHRVLVIGEGPARPALDLEVDV